MKKKFSNLNPKGFNGGPRNLVVMVVLLVGSLIILSQLGHIILNTTVISYSEFVSAVNQDKVKAVTVSGKSIHGVYKQGTQKFETNIPENSTIMDQLIAHDVYVHIVEPSGFQTWHFFLFGAFLLSLLAAWYFFRQMKGQNGGGGGANIFGMGKNRARMFMPSTIKTTFADVAGADTAKEALKDFVDFLRNPEKYRRLGAQMTSGILLVGDPGNGKTLLAKAVAGEANCPFFSVSGSDFIEVFVGVGAARVRDLFAQARKHAPCIIFIDEIDAIGRHRGGGIGGGNDEREQTLNQLLAEMDGFSSKQQNIIIIAATNRPEVLDKALVRRGRFDRHIVVPYPEEKDRETILRLHASKVKLDSAIDLAQVAKDTAGFTGSDLANLVNQAAIIASRESGRDIVTKGDFDKAVKQVTSTKGNEESGGGGESAAGMTKSHVKMIMPSMVKVKFADVAGAHEAKEELQDFVSFLKEPQKFKRLGAHMNRGILLEGEPGNGKTLLAKAVAGEAGRPFFAVSGSEFVEVFVGVGAARVRDLFAQARKHAPSIVFIDEIDTIGRARSHGPYGSQEQEQTLNQLLTEMDGFSTKDSDVIIIAATNRADMLDKALVRPGRFDKTIHVPYPDLKSREQILNIHAAKIKMGEDADLSKVARGTAGWTGAHLAGLVNEAAMIATKKEERAAVTMADLDEARDKIIIGQESKSVFPTKQELWLTAYHEAGHALVGLLMPHEHIDPLYKVTIVPRGPALGVTFHLPDREKYTRSKEMCLAYIAMCMGGRAAEHLACNTLGAGAESDFTSATSMARAMVCQWGMSEKLGPVIYNPRANPHDYSERTRSLIDEEVQAILEGSLKRAMTLLAEHRDKLEKIAAALMEKETMSAQEVYELLGMEPRPEPEQPYVRGQA
ncbi:MAG: ATP-dependent zinc metalloprotease FtsH [Candidatus Babeliales bacterium]